MSTHTPWTPNWDAQISAYIPQFKFEPSDAADFFISVEYLQKLIIKLNEYMGVTLPYATEKDIVETLNKSLSKITIRNVLPAIKPCSTLYQRLLCEMFNVGLATYKDQNIGQQFLTTPNVSDAPPQPTTPINMTDELEDLASKMAATNPLAKKNKTISNQSQDDYEDDMTYEDAMAYHGDYYDGYDEYY